MKILEKLNPKNTVSFNRPLAHALGLNEAVVYAALIAKQEYYEKHNMLDKDSYFYSTVTDLQESTSLTKRQQTSAVQKLTDCGLIDYDRHCSGGRRRFIVRDNVEILNKYLEQGEAVMTGLNPTAQKCRNVTSESDKNALLEITNCDFQKEQNVTSLYNNPEIIKPEIKNPYPSIKSDGRDEMDINKREEYRRIIHENIEYECVLARDKTKTDELIEVMLDVICTPSDTVRVNGADIPHETVKSRFLKLNSNHIEYVMGSLKKNTTDVRNIRAYLITALYNSPATIDSYYISQVNHDLHGSG